MNRSTYAILGLATIGLGLLLRASRSALPPSVVDVGGDALWAAMVFWWIGAVWPRARLASRGGGALGIAYLVELSQLVRTPWLDRLRGTTLGHLVLGSDFDGRDLIAYTIGVAAAAVLELVVMSRRQDR